MGDQLNSCIEKAAKLCGISVEEFRAEAHLGAPKGTLGFALDIIHNSDALPRRRPDAYLEVLRHALQQEDLKSSEVLESAA